MTQQDQRPARTSGRTAVLGGTRAAARRATPPGLARLFDALRARLAEDLAGEAASGRRILWLPVAYTLGILLYFGAGQEPSLIAVLLLLGALAAGAMGVRAQPVAFGAVVGFAAVVAGFATASVRTTLVAHEIAAPPKGPVRLTGFVERVEHRPTGDRTLLRLDAGPVKGLDPVPGRVRLSLRKGWAPPVGTHITQLTQLLPPLGPVMPGAHDFGRTPWFAGIGGVGYGLGRPRPAEAAAPPLSVRLAMAVDAARDSLSRRIRASLTGATAEIAVALVAGDRSAIAPEVEESMRVSGLTHILSISGLHMALVAGTLFAFVRGGLALVPALALGLPIKALAAVAALTGSAAYLVLAGNDVPAQRSFVMTALVLSGVLVGRPALTLRTVGVAAVAVLAFTPEAALEPGTQMSFAATLALVAAYERLRPLAALPRPDGWAGQAAVWLAVLVGGTALTSLVAGLATAPYGIFHFQRVAPYGLLANLAAMPAVSFLVMPFGLLGVLLIPFGFDHLAWPVMGKGIEIMVTVSDTIAVLPGADHRVDSVGAPTLAFFSLGLAALCLLRGLLAATALVPFALALLLAGAPPRPDLLVAPDAQTVAVRGPDGRLSVLGARSQRLVVEQWLTREGDRRKAGAEGLAGLFACDPFGCTAPLPGGGTIAVSRRAESLEADCLESRIVVTRDVPPRHCPAEVVTPEHLSRTGTLAFHFRDGTWHVEPTRNPRVNRPWMAPVPPEPDPPRPGDDDPEADAASQ
ncbi:ComEC/Rec2 family competence protein [Xanthobacter autotrophicus]|uniref:ComEC/Rec2 family competence protein n=1 Tax=Xanthobacter TaxID=279 RepID=UPI0024AC2656|nr:ComEC/Rec2 family competence protein [Xanthobacter autotrophicus]MDI4664349.1 ComEC/Rec2 family competence protein [Xanthobacter autotrophicus]